MAEHTLCDSCHRIIYDDPRYRHRARLAVTVTDSRYRSGGLSPRLHNLDLCDRCDTKIAVALVGLLPHLASDIDPNCFGIAEEQAAQHGS